MILEKLWNDYLVEDCAAIRTEKEKSLSKKAMELYEKVNALLDKEQESVLDEYIDTLYDMEAIFVKKAFIKGCRFAVSFLLETEGVEKWTL